MAKSIVNRAIFRKTRRRRHLPAVAVRARENGDSMFIQHGENGVTVVPSIMSLLLSGYLFNQGQVVLIERRC